MRAALTRGSIRLMQITTRIVTAVTGFLIPETRSAAEWEKHATEMERLRLAELRKEQRLNR